MHYITGITKKIKIIALFSAILLLVSSCVTTSTTRGYNLERLSKSQEKIVPGQTSKQDVLRLLGSSSTSSTFGDDTWYYISTKSEAVAFLKPKIVEHKILAITFDENNIVQASNEYDRNDIAQITVNGDITPTEGHDITVIQQLLGNVGRFNSGGNERIPGGGSGL